MSRVISLLLLLIIAAEAAAQANTEPLAAKVKDCISRGVHFLTLHDSAWEGTSSENRGGATALNVLALLNCDGMLDEKLEQRRKASIERGLQYLRNIHSDKVYVRALQTMAFAEAGKAQDRGRIEENVRWLLAARIYRDGKFIGWYYTQRPQTMASDASNSQYAMLALWYARQAGVKIDRAVWEQIRDYYTRSQIGDDKNQGAYVYSKDYGPNGTDKDRPSRSMTIAGLCGLLIAGMELNGGREVWLPSGEVKNCGVYNESHAVARSLRWINATFNVELDQRTYYHLYGIERAGRLSGLRFFSDHDWYREGCEFLTRKQQQLDGSWPRHAAWAMYAPHANTAFALLFLSKGRTPVAISKLVHGKWQPPIGRLEQDSNWNNDRNDLRHLTEYVSKKENNPFESHPPLAWQTYDISQARQAQLNGGLPENQVDDAVVADMLQSPILYITGHNRPDLRIQAVENKLIQRYVENGGFIFAEACCSSPDFDAGIEKWVAMMWPDAELKLLEGTHPIWTCRNTITPGDPYKLKGVQVGCRFVMIYSPQDMSCHWESNRLEHGPTRRAFELGANIIAYATGSVAPLPRLTPIQLAGEKPKDDPSQRDAFRVGRIIFSGDSNPAPKAMQNLMVHFHNITRTDIVIQAQPIELRESNEVFTTKFFYMHGRGKIKTEDDLKPFRIALENGGLLLADACEGDPAFDKSFRLFVRQLFPDQKLEEVPKTDLLYSAELNKPNLKGETLSAQNIRIRTQKNGPMQAMDPYLEGIRIKGRWVVLYSKYDLGCALEKSASAGLTYDPASALRIATAAVLYNARP